LNTIRIHRLDIYSVLRFRMFQTVYGPMSMIMLVTKYWEYQLMSLESETLSRGIKSYRILSIKTYNSNSKVSSRLIKIITKSDGRLLDYLRLLSLINVIDY